MPGAPMARPLRIYVYKNCDSCRRALKFLDGRDIPHVAVPIRETPPTKAEIRRMLALTGGKLSKLFSTSGRDYRELQLGTRLGSMTADEAIGLLASNGNLVRRPFALSASAGAVGFNEAEWTEKFSR